MDLEGMIDVRPGVRSGKRCFVGTRTTVDDLLDYLASGMPHHHITVDSQRVAEVGSVPHL